jgi:methionyl-tRNA formyltransferase
MMKTVILASNRTGVFDAITSIPFLRLKHVFALEQSAMHRRPHAYEHSTFTTEASDEFLNKLASMDFDILVSNGCPVVLPVSKLRKPHQIFLNVHPSLLPQFRGYHPANGVLFHNASEAGATLHEMTDRVDKGKIVYQERFPITPDLDLGLLYHLLFDAEQRAFRHGIHALATEEFRWSGESQTEQGSHYRRRAEDMSVDFKTMTDGEILNRIRAFGVASQGVRAMIDGRMHTLFEAQSLRHPRLLEMHHNQPPGCSVFEYERNLVVRSLESLIRVSRFTRD